MFNNKVPVLLKQLGLPTIYSHWEEFADKAKIEHWSYSQYLAELAELEVIERYKKRVQRYIKESKLPVGKTLEMFDFTAAKNINPAQIQALAEDVSWVKKGENVIIFGPSGVGKTHLAAAIGYSLIAQDFRVLFSSTTSLVQKLQAAKKEYKLSEALNKLSYFSLIILDDIGYVKKDESETSVLFELIADRYEHSSTIITSNHPFSEWDKIFPDTIMTVAAIDRLIHHAIIVNFEGTQSYRITQAEKRKIRP